ncbi:MAG: Cdc6/Cdc18 family protein [Halopenitus sp.]
MITRPLVFRDEHLPGELRHREPQIRQIIQELNRMTAEALDQDVLISGPSGVGKTVLGRHTLDEYAAEHGLPWTRIRTLGMTSGDVLREVIDQHPSDVTVAANTPNDELPDILREVVDEHYVVMLDEGDGLPETGAVRELVDVPNVGVLVVCHDAMDWLSRADPRVRDHFQGGQVELSRYSVDELADILEDRARAGLYPDAVSRAQLESIADGVAGVARNGIQTLRAAAELAADRGHDTIYDDDVADGYERARRHIRAANLNSLPLHHLVLYEIIRTGGRVQASELHERYETIADDIYAGRPKVPISRRDRRNKLAKLREYDLVVREQVNHRWFYSAVDEGLAPPVEFSLTGSTSVS